jgi:hypothetical protein
MVIALQELYVQFDSLRDREQRAAIEHLRRLPCLRFLCFKDSSYGQGCPSFVPSSLTHLSLRTEHMPSLESLLRDVPSMLETSGARLKKFSVRFVGIRAEGGAALARVLRVCAPTLKTLDLCKSEDDGDCSACAPEVARGIASCSKKLQELHMPWVIFSNLSPEVSFTHLTNLSLDGRLVPIDFSAPVWDLVAERGWLPSLEDIHLSDFSISVGFGVRLGRVFDGVSGTLTRLPICDPVPHPADAIFYELGVAISKLRRLTCVPIA